MKSVKLYNVIFPIWFILFFPPVVLITFVGNYFIDSLVVIACFYVFKVKQLNLDLKTFYKKSIIKVWVFGFLADLIGAAILLLFSMFGDSLGLPYEVTSAISYNSFKHPAAIIIIIFAMIVSSIFIFLFDYKISFRDLVEDKHLKMKIAFTIAIITIPWTFILPTEWFYSGF